MAANRPVKGVFSGNLNGTSEVTMYDPDGATVTQQANERLEITGFECSTATGNVIVTLFADEDDDNAVDAGEELARWRFAAVVGGLPSVDCSGAPRIGALGAKPHLNTSGAADISVMFTGRLVREG